MGDNYTVSKIVPRDYQVEAHDATFNYFQYNPVGDPLIGLPTGTGKGLVIAMIMTSITAGFPGEKVICATHVKELVDQNYIELKKYWPAANVGIHSQGLRRRDVVQPNIFANIQSMRKTLERYPNAFGNVGILIVDEAHLVDDKDGGNYDFVIKCLKEVNPYLRIIGLTATPYRLKSGLLTESGIFTDFCYNKTSLAKFNEFVHKGYLCKLLSKRTDVFINTDDVQIIGGEFNQKQLEEVSAIEAITEGAIREALHYGASRESWLVFTSGIMHCEQVAKCLDKYNISVDFAHSKRSVVENDKAIRDFKSGKIRSLVNANMLTTGFNCPQIDLIIDLAATNSPVRHVQKYGRGTRPYYNEIRDKRKDNCLVLDFARNTNRLGPINDPVVPMPRGKGGPKGVAPIKECSNCNIFNHISARFCEACGQEFPIEIKIRQTASQNVVMKGIGDENDKSVQIWVTLRSVGYEKRKSFKSGKDMFVVNYFGKDDSGKSHSVKEHIMPDHEKAYPKMLAKKWWSDVTRGLSKSDIIPMPSTVDIIDSLKEQLKKPTRILVEPDKKDDKFYSVLQREFS